jgi:hypothetical protein
VGEVPYPADRRCIAAGVTRLHPRSGHKSVGRLVRLTTRGVIELRDRGHVKIVDRAAFDKIAGDPPALPATELLSRD